MAIEADAVYDTHGTRLTCVTLADGDIPESKVNGKRKRDVDKVEDGNDPEEVDPGDQEAREEGEEEEKEAEEED